LKVLAATILNGDENDIRRITAELQKTGLARDYTIAVLSKKYEFATVDQVVQKLETLLGELKKSAEGS